MRQLARLLCVFFVTIIVLDPAVFAHDHDENFKEVIDVHNSLIELFTAYIKDTEGVAPQDIGYVDPVGQGNHDDMIPVNMSAVNQIMALAATRLNGPHCHHCSKDSFLKYALSFLTNIPLRIYRSLQNPAVSAADIYKAAEAFVTRTLYRFSPAVAAILILSESAWETFEFVFFSLLGAHGLHVACTLVNGLLIAAAIPLDRILSLSQNQGSNLGLLNRLSTALVSFYMNFRADWLGNYTEIKRNEPDGLAPYFPTYFKSPERSEKLSDLQHIMLRHQLHGAVLSSLLDAKKLVVSKSLVDDLDLIFDHGRRREEKFYVAFMQSQTMKIMTESFEKTVSQLRTNKILKRADYLPLDKIVGRMQRIAFLYGSSLEFFASQNAGPIPARLKGLYKEFITEFFEVLNFAKFVSDEHPNPNFVFDSHLPDNPHGPQVTFSTKEMTDMLDKKTLSLYDKITSLRSPTPGIVREKTMFQRCLAAIGI